MRETTAENTQEARELVLTIVRVLPHSAGARVAQDDAEVIAIELPDRKGERLRRALFSRAAVGELLADASREVKVEYLQREISQAARSRRHEYRYPRHFEVLAPVAERSTMRSSDKQGRVSASAWAV